MEPMGSSSHQIPNITTCSISLETFKDPKVLPCIHTFCFHCLDSYCKNKEDSCPLCRKVFTISSGGIEDLPNNDFMNQLINLNKSYRNTGTQESDKQPPCEMCSDSDAEITSTSYCVDCDQHICDRCSLTHRRANVSKVHQVLPHSNLPSSQKRVKLSIDYCKQHPCEQNKLYCYDCKIILCPTCVSKHNQHKLSCVDEAAEIFRDQLNDDVNILSTCILKQQANLDKLDLDAEYFSTNVSATQSEILQKCDKLISLIQSHKAELMEQIGQFKDKILKEMATKKDEMERQFVMTESFKRYCTEMMNKGAACDLTRTAHDLHARVEELVKTQDEPDGRDLSDVEMTFRPSLPTLSTTDSVRSLIGDLVLEGESVIMKDNEINEEDINLTTFLTKHAFVQVLPSTQQAIAGIAVLDSEVFVIRSAPNVDVYESDDFTWKRDFIITGSEHLKGLVACSNYNCLNACDGEEKNIYRYDLTSDETACWLTDDEVYGLSVTKCYTVLATLHLRKRINEYMSDGSLMREISLDSSIAGPWHCVQLSTGNYVVSQVEEDHRICIVDQSGRIIQSYGSRGSGVGQLDNPFHLMAVDLKDNVLVIDGDNGRVRLFSQTLSHLGDMAIPRYQFKDPYTVHYDVLNQRLYIGEWDGNRIFALSLS